MPSVLPFGLIALLLFTGLGVAVLRRPPIAPLHPYLLLCIACGFLWTAGETWASLATNSASKHVALAVLYTGSLLMPPFWWVVMLRWTGAHGLGGPGPGRIAERLPLGLGAALWGLMATQPWHGRFVTPVVGGRNLYHEGFYVALGVGYAETMAAALLCLWVARRHARPDVRRAGATLAAAPLLLTAANAVYVLTPLSPPSSLTGPALLASGGLVAAALVGTRRQWRLPAAIPEVLRHDPQGVVLADPRGRVFFSNPAAQRALAFLRLGPDIDLWEALAGRLRGEDPAERPLGRDALVTRLLAAGGSGRVFRCGDARLWIAATPIPGRRGMAAMALRVTDVTVLRRAERERRVLEDRIHEAERLRGLGVLAGGIAHDFNNRLTAILGNATLAQGALDPGDPLTVSLREIEAAALDATQLTRQLLAASGRASLSTRRLDPSREVESAARWLAPTLPPAVELRTLLADDLPAVRADPDALRQVLSRLVTNACEARGEDAGWVTVRTGLAERPADGDAPPLTRPLPAGTYVFVEVQDAGHGMDAETRARAFEPFFSTRGEGRGLGLAVAAGIAHAHGGALGIASWPGRGSRVRLWLPSVSRERAAEEPPAPAAPGSDWRGHGRVLVVDDEAAVRRVARAILENLGFEVVEAAGGREGLERFHRHRGDLRLALLDVGMPDLSGERVLSEIRRVDPDLPVLLSSGLPDGTGTGRGPDAKPTGFVDKPYRAEELAARVRAALEASSA